MQRTAAAFGILFFGCFCEAAEESTPLLPSLRDHVEPPPLPTLVPEVSLAHAPAQNKTESRSSVHFTFAVPDYDSAISLGVFDVGGQLIRTIATSRPENEFPIGLNGLIAEWDWKNQFGEAVPDGEYFIRGYAVGHFEESQKVEFPVTWGDAFGEGLDIIKIQELGVGPNGFLFLLGLDTEARAVLIAYDPAKNARLWSRTLGHSSGENWVLGQPANPVLAVMGNGDLEILDHQTGRVLLRGKVAGNVEKVYSLRLAPEEVQWVTDAGVQRVSMVDLAPLEPLRGLPRQIMRYFGGAPNRIVLDTEGRLWVENPGWVIFLHQDGAWFEDFIPGREGRFWALVREHREGEQRLGQFNTAGEFLRQIQPETFDGTPSVFAAGNDETTLFVLSKNQELQDKQLLGIRRKILEGPSTWETFWEKRLDPMQLLLADGYRRLPLRMKIEVTSALGRGREVNTFRLLINESGIQLVASDGLELGTIWQGANIRAATASAAQNDPRALMFRVLKDGRIEEGKTSGLDRIAKIDAGRFVWPPEEE